MKRILIIDDDQNIRDMLYRMLTHCGYTVETTSDGQEGIDILMKNKFFSTVITDISMPQKTGNDVAGYIRKFYKKRRPRVIGVTGKIEMADKDLFDYLLRKPFKIKDLVQVIENDDQVQNFSINELPRCSQRGCSF